MHKIKFKRNFTSPALGNVWIGREITLKSKEAEKYVNMGWAELAEKAKIEDNKAKYAKKVEENGDSKSKRSKKPSKGRSKR